MPTAVTLLAALAFAAPGLQAPQTAIESKPQGGARQVQDPKHAADLKRDADLGKQYASEAEKELKASKSQLHIDRVNRIGDEIAAIANLNQVKALWGDPRLNPFEYHFKVVEGKDVNAFSLPGGYIFVYEGLLDFVESDDELAGVLSHEIAHASFRHLATLMREQSRFDAFSIPLILIAILSGGQAGTGSLVLRDLINQAGRSGWSQKAEDSADYGAFQYMLQSKYSPVALLTFMERLAATQRAIEAIDWGIFRTHPPSRDRAELITSYLNAAKIQIRRSQVSLSFRTVAKDGSSGSIGVEFNGRKLHTFAGVEAKVRAEEAVLKLNAFFDTVPELFEVQAMPDGTVVGRKRALFTVSPADAEAAGSSVDKLTSDSVRAMKRSLYMLAFRVWDAR